MKLEDWRIRDPFVYNDGHRLILYGSTSVGCGAKQKSVFVASTSSDMENWSDPVTIFEAGSNFWGTRDFWAPEMHAYEGAYYLFASFAADRRKRATAVLRAQDPLGPFVPYGSEQITPMDWQCLDGTLHVEGDTPYMVFCHEWVECGDGEMWAVPMEKDLSGAAGEPVFLFRASEAPWCRPLSGVKHGAVADPYVTDGPFLFRGQDGGLKMLWSSFSAGGRYTVGLAFSEGGVCGPWRQQAEPVFAQDGGHAMLFTDLQGQLRLSLHQPNDGPRERARFLRAEWTEHGIGLRPEER
ncbi:MAG TPA: family 43 glycosylhydrolase [Candidatus Alectryocaccomicrobium excrementavium]|uniref:Family 43 glycosylhydrolase n=1 Tax=Candidatus Alectryocaccomicrobium excrementavium TaxID=2840668 RepID=A0A9D1FYZ6_9FIRM|nr:family 43 glycosylhydrolase [Candidatus Alectryocaccomicrobium excrementavium]